MKVEFGVFVQQYGEHVKNQNFNLKDRWTEGIDRITVIDHIIFLLLV